MKVIVAGGRDFVPSLAHKNWLTEQLRNLNATEIVSGHARGADTFGEQMAHVLELNTTIFPAKWISMERKQAIFVMKKWQSMQLHVYSFRVEREHSI